MRIYLSLILTRTSRNQKVTVTVTTPVSSSGYVIRSFCITVTRKTFDDTGFVTIRRYQKFRHFGKNFIYN